MTAHAIHEDEDWGGNRGDSSLRALANLDRRLAWVVTCVPAAGTIVALALPFFGIPITGVEIGLWLTLHMLSLTGVEIGYHRLLSHRSFKAHTAVRVTLAILGSMAFQGPVIWWAATHRRHHSFSDREGDPHSPHLHGKLLRGLFHAHMGWLFVQESTRARGWDRYVLDLYRDRAMFRVHANYFVWLALGLVLPGVAGGLLTLSWIGVLLGILWGGLVRIFCVNNVFWAINSVTHTFGTRPLRANDQSTNNIWLAIPTLGQSWHNNHHAFPSSAVMSVRWWEVDIGAWLIRALEKVGLVWDVKVPTAEMISRLRKDEEK